MVGRRSLWRQRRFRTSSAKPRKIMQQMARSEPMSSTNCGTENRTPVTDGRSLPAPATLPGPGKPHLVMRKGHALLLHEAPQEGHRDEAEEDDQEHGPADHALRFGAERKVRRGVSLGAAGPGAGPALRGSATHTGRREALLRSSPKSRAARKWSLKAGISTSVPTKPSSDPPRLMRRGTAGQAAMATAGATPAKGTERGRERSAARQRRSPRVSSRTLERRHRMPGSPPAYRRRAAPSLPLARAACRRGALLGRDR